MIKLRSERDYLEATSEIGDIDDPAVKQDLEAAIREYELGRGPAGGVSGVEAFEYATPGDFTPAKPAKRTPTKEGVRPSMTDEELEFNAPLPASIPEMPELKRGGRTEGSRLGQRVWHEPTLEQFKAEMEPEIGVKNAAGITEQSDLFKRYADMKWADAFDKAEKSGRALVRARDIDESTLGGRVEKGLASANKYLDPLLLGIEEGGTGGLAVGALAKGEELTGSNPDALAELEEARSLSPGARTVGNVVGMLSPFGLGAQVGKAALKAAAPALGSLVVKGGGRLPGRLAARAGAGATAGGAGLAAQGGAQDIAQGVNPFSLDFLSRRGSDAAIGAAGGVVGEGLGAVSSRLGRAGEVARAKDVAAEASMARRLGPILEATGPSAAGAGLGYLTAEKDQKLIGALAGAAALGNGWGRYQLLTSLGRGVPKAGEGFFKAAAAKLQAAPLPPDVVGAIRERMITKGGEVFGGRTGAGVGATFGIPFTSSPGQEPRLSQEEAEAFIQLLQKEETATPTLDEELEGAPAEPTDSGETTGIGLTSSGAGVATLPDTELPEMEVVAEEQPVQVTRESMQAREAAIAKRIKARWQGREEESDIVDQGAREEKLNKAAEVFARREAGPDADPMKIFVLKTKFLMHERQRALDREIEAAIQEDMQINPEHWRSTEEGRQGIRNLPGLSNPRNAKRAGFYQPPKFQ